MKPDAQRERGAGTSFRTVYYLYGDETFLMEREEKRLVTALVPPDMADFNYDLLYGNERKGEEIAAAAQTLPMFAQRRVVVVRRSEGLGERDLEVLGEYLKNPSPTTCLIFTGKKPDLRRRFFADLKKMGALVEFKPPYENQLVSFIGAEAVRLGNRIAPEAAELLVALTGNNLRELASQLDKLAAYAGEAKPITLDTVKTLASDTRADSVFDLSNSLGERQLATSLRKLQTLLRDGQAPLMILAMVTRHFRQLWRLRELMARKVPQHELGRALGLKSDYFLPGLKKQAENFTLAEFRILFGRLFDTDLSLKSSRLKPVFIMEQLVTAICQPPPRPLA